MRLDDVEKTALKRAVDGIDGEVYLFGARIDDDKKGGDIDVRIFSSQNKYNLSQQVAIEFFSECEEKIDVTVMDPENLSAEEQAFLNVITLEEFR